VLGSRLELRVTSNGPGWLFAGSGDPAYRRRRHTLQSVHLFQPRVGRACASVLASRLELRVVSDDSGWPFAGSGDPAYRRRRPHFAKCAPVPTTVEQASLRPGGVAWRSAAL